MITWQTACDEITINYGNANFNRCCVTHGQSRNYRTFQMIRRSLGVHFTSARWVCQAYTNENFIIHHPFYLVESSPSKLWSWDQSENLLKGTIRTVVKALCLTDTHLELHRSNAKCLFQKSELHIVALLNWGSFGWSRSWTVSNRIFISKIESKPRTVHRVFRVVQYYYTPSRWSI